MKIKDQLHRTLHLNNTPKRIVSLVPSQTELLVDLGLEDSLVGVTRFCVHPKHLRKEKLVVGGTKKVNVTKIEALRPDIILCNKEENTTEIIDQLKDIAPIHISDIYSIDDTLELINCYGHLFDCKEAADIICNKIVMEFEKFKVFRSSRKPLKVAYFIWKNPWMVAASATYINAMLAVNGFENVFDGLKRYPEIFLVDEELQKAEIILLSSEPYPFKDKHITELNTLYPNARVVLVDGEFFSWYGSRLILAFDYFKTFRFKLEQLSL